MNRFGGPTITNPNRLSMDTIKEILESKSMNPTIARLIFMETRKGPNVERKVFPCYPVKLSEDEKVLTVSVAQCTTNQYLFGVARLPVEDLGVVFRFWDMPPSDELLDIDPLKPAEPKPAEESKPEENPQ